MELIRQVRYFFLLFIGLCVATVVSAQSPCFTVSKKKGCVPFTIVMSNCSGYPTPRYDYGETPGQMHFENANIHTYTKPGVYSITQLISQVGNSNNTLTQKDLITVYANESPAFRVDYCANYWVRVTITENVYESNRVTWGGGHPASTLKYGEYDQKQYSDSSIRMINVQGIYDSTACGGVVDVEVKPGLDWKAPVLSKVETKGNALVLDYTEVSPINYKLDRIDPITGSIVATESIAYVPGATSYTLQNVSSEQNWILQMTGYDVCGAEFRDIKISSLWMKGETLDNHNILSWNYAKTADFVEFELKRDGVTVYKGGAASFVDLDVVCNKEYSYQLFTTLRNGRQSVSDEVKLKTFTKNVPPVVTKVSSTVGVDSIYISWNKALVETNYYDVFAVEGNDTILLKKDYKETSLRLPITKSNLGRCYFIKYTDLCGNRSLASGLTCLVSLKLVSYDKASGATTLEWTSHKTDGVAYTDYALLIVDKKGNVIDENQLGNEFIYTDNVKDTVNQMKTYKIKASSALNPFVSYSNSIKVEQSSTFFVPNAFTPDGDGLNDVFMPKGRYIVSYKLGIFNRWGELVFTSNEFGGGWDGTVNGVQAPAAVYSYVVDATDSLGKSYQKKGNVTLIR